MSATGDPDPMTDLTTLLRDLSEKAGKATKGPWAVLRAFPQYVVPLGQQDRPSGGATDEETDRRYAQPIVTANYDTFTGFAHRLDKAEAHRNAAYLAACPPALIQALVEVVMQANAYRDGGWDSRELCKSLDRLEAVAQHLQS